MVFDVMKHSPPKVVEKMIQEGDKFYIFELGVLSGPVYGNSSVFCLYLLS